jgi:hypothetical protein
MKRTEKYPFSGRESNNDPSVRLASDVARFKLLMPRRAKNRERIDFILKSHFNYKSYENALLLAVKDLFPWQQVMNENMLVCVMQ